ncbi:hypothetical protein Syun_017306 [Stephania yunnanensis]|uniref:Uncharacterized protein n=1 Tax=Stephania yunnanensis TaxID=152371 RepID=A0AAP0J6U0_9MAGN
MCKTGATTESGGSSATGGAMECEDDSLGVGDLGASDWRETERPERDTTITVTESQVEASETRCCSSNNLCYSDEEA